MTTESIKAMAGKLKDPAVLVTVLCALWGAAIIYMSAGRGVKFFFVNTRLALFTFGIIQVVIELIKRAVRTPPGDSPESYAEAMRIEKTGATEA